MIHIITTFKSYINESINEIYKKYIQLAILQLAVLIILLSNISYSHFNNHEFKYQDSNILNSYISNYYIDINSGIFGTANKDFVNISVIGSFNKDIYASVLPFILKTGLDLGFIINKNINNNNKVNKNASIFDILLGSKIYIKSYQFPYLSYGVYSSLLINASTFSLIEDYKDIKTKLKEYISLNVGLGVDINVPLYKNDSFVLSKSINLKSGYRFDFTEDQFIAKSNSLEFGLNIIYDL